MTPKPSRPGAHGEPIPDDSHTFIAECAEEDRCDSCGCVGELKLLSDSDHRMVCEDYPSCGGVLPDAHDFIAECGPFIGQDLESEAEHQHMEAQFPPPAKPAQRRLQTRTVEITMEVRGDLIRHINAALASIPTAGGQKKWEYLNAD